MMNYLLLIAVFACVVASGNMLYKNIKSYNDKIRLQKYLSLTIMDKAYFKIDGKVKLCRVIEINKQMALMRVFVIGEKNPRMVDFKDFKRKERVK